MQKTLPKGKGNQLPPTLDHVVIYFQQKGSSETSARSFFSHYDNKGWLNNRNSPLSNWKNAAWEWIWKNNFSSMSR